MKFRRTVSMNPRTTLLLQRLGAQRQEPCAALVQRLIENAAQVEGVTVNDADVEDFKRALRRVDDGVSKMTRIREAGA